MPDPDAHNPDLVECHRRLNLLSMDVSSLKTAVRDAEKSTVMKAVGQLIGDLMRFLWVYLDVQTPTEWSCRRKVDDRMVTIVIKSVPVADVKDKGPTQEGDTYFDDDEA